MSEYDFKHELVAIFRQWARTTQDAATQTIEQCDALCAQARLIVANGRLPPDVQIRTEAFCKEIEKTRQRIAADAEQVHADIDELAEQLLHTA